ncbi:MAG: glycosyltransferase [Eubacteriales bacterium]|nr:glycosyltransferase [Eubacteriales bacterium]
MAQTIRVLHMLYGKKSEEIAYLLLEYAKRMNPRYVCFDFYFCGTVPDGFRAKVDGIGSRIYSAAPMGTAFSKRKLTAFFGQHTEYRIVHTHLEEQSAIALEAAQKAGVPVRICHAHGQRKPQDHGLYLPAANTRICRAATYLFADCVAVGEHLFGVNALERVIVFPLFVDCAVLRWSIQQRKNMRDRLGISYRTLVIGCIDPMLTRSEFEHVLTIVHHVRMQFADVHLILTGELQKYERILEKARHRVLDVTFLAEHGECKRYLPAADVCLFCGNLLRIPYGLMQAQIAGVPCVVSDRIPKEAVVSPLACTLYCHRPVAQWAQCVLMAAAQPRSTTQPEWTEEYDINRSAAWLERLYWEEGQVGKEKRTPQEVGKNKK